MVMNAFDINQLGLFWHSLYFLTAFSIRSIILKCPKHPLVSSNILPEHKPKPLMLN